MSSTQFVWVFFISVWIVFGLLILNMMRAWLRGFFGQFGGVGGFTATLLLLVGVTVAIKTRFISWHWLVLAIIVIVIIERVVLLLKRLASKKPDSEKTIRGRPAFEGKSRSVPQ